MAKSEFQTDKKLIVGEIYRPPDQSIKDYINSFQDLLAALGRENAYCFLLGDFNINILKANGQNIVSDFINTMLSYCFIPLISRPTRVTEHTASLIDNILTNAIDLLESDRTKSGIVFNDISDHYPIFHVIKSKLTKNRSQVTFYIRMS